MFYLGEWAGENNIDSTVSDNDSRHIKLFKPQITIITYMLFCL